MAMGVAKLACCHPDALSPEKVTLPRSAPALVHSLPTWVPVLRVALKKRTPVTNPLTSARNLVPSSTASGSLSSRIGGTVAGVQIEHGHVGPGGGGLADVVNDHEALAASAFPAVSFTRGSAVPPRTRTVYVVESASALA